jgi:hypothetical protein
MVMERAVRAFKVEPQPPRLCFMGFMTSLRYNNASLPQRSEGAMHWRFWRAGMPLRTPPPPSRG